MKFQVANGEVINAVGVAHVSIQMYGYIFKLLVFVCDLGDLDCIFGLDALKIGRIWFNAHEKSEPHQM